MPDYQTQNFERDYPSGFTPLKDWRELAPYCWLCHQLFENDTALRAHRFREHPQAEQPSLVLGRMLSRYEVLRSPYDSEDLQVFDCTAMDFGSGLVPADDGLARIKGLLANPPAGGFSVSLINHPGRGKGEAEATFRFELRLDDAIDLTSLEEVFLNSPHCTDACLANLDTAVQRVTTAREYGSQLYAFALANWARSVSSDEIDWGEKLRGCIGLLRQYDRPLAHSICMAARWSLNYFPGSIYLTGTEPFDRAFQRMRVLCGQPSEPVSKDVCLSGVSILDWLDSVSRELIVMAAGNSSDDAIKALEARCVWPQDRLKLIAMRVALSPSPLKVDLAALEDGGPFARRTLQSTLEGA